MSKAKCVQVMIPMTSLKSVNVNWSGAFCSSLVHCMLQIDYSEAFVWWTRSYLLYSTHSCIQKYAICCMFEEFWRTSADAFCVDYNRQVSSKESCIMFCLDCLIFVICFILHSNQDTRIMWKNFVMQLCDYPPASCLWGSLLYTCRLTEDIFLLWSAFEQVVVIDCQIMMKTT